MVIGITVGDPAGIGPEIVDLALRSSRLARDVQYRVIGVRTAANAGAPRPETALQAFDALEEAVTLATDGRIDAVVTGPVCKFRMQEIGFAFPGQTEFFATRTGTDNYAMMLTGGKLTVALVTAHLPLAKVAVSLKRAEIARVGALLAEFLFFRYGQSTRIAVAGLNPHAGESGSLGREEIEIIEPAIGDLQRMKPSGATFEGPISPDTLFYRAAQGEWNGVLCMYHDQGLIPLKMHAFDGGVNVTLGLPFVRTSPDHGTAFELAGKRLARPDSMISAINLAVEISGRRGRG
jgi:4-hydroxythreonine-4-phosphate dehydrogenase